MRLTVTELPGEMSRLDDAWDGLIAHLTVHMSDVVVLPEMPFAPWLPATDRVDPNAWQDAIASHDRWSARFPELGVETVIGSRPVEVNGVRGNEAFAWTRSGMQSLHLKHFLPDEPGFWEATWYQPGEGAFAAAETPHGSVGALICTELWFTDHARAYAADGVTLIANSRATEWASRDKWLAGGRAAAVMAGAFCLSANRTGEADGIRWGGLGWIIDPDGEVLRTTSADDPFVTIEVDAAAAAEAKTTYPRYVYRPAD